MTKVKEVKPWSDYKFSLSFWDGQNGTVDIKPFHDKGISLKLLPVSYFSKVLIDEFWGIC